MNTKHTPGPWHDMGGGIGRVADDGDLMVVIPISYRPVPNEADVRLASAAPDLLQSLEAIVFAISPDGNDSNCEPFFRQVLAVARFAIAKATGDA